MSDDTTPMSGNALPDDAMAADSPADPPAGPPSPPPKKGTVGKKIGILVGVLALAGGGAFAATQLSGPKSNTPEDAVKDMLTAVAKGDVDRKSVV